MPRRLRSFRLRTLMLFVAAGALAFALARWAERPYPWGKLVQSDGSVALSWSDGTMRPLWPGEPYPVDNQYGRRWLAITWSDGSVSWHLHNPPWRAP